MVFTVFEISQVCQFYHYIPKKNMLEDLCEPALSIRLNQSEDSEWSDHHSPTPEKEVFKLKCFRCFGKHDHQCRECNGTEMVTSEHPLAFLLGQVLQRKLSFAPSDDRRVCPIKEEEQEIEERRATCVVCINDCSMEEEHCCQPLYPARDESCCSEVQMDLSACRFLKEEHKQCHNCQTSIENCYSVCQTCKADGHTYWLCDVCSDSHRFTHPLNHHFQPVIDYDELKDNKIQTISQEFQDESHQNDFLDQQVLTLQKKNSSIANYLEQDSCHFLMNNSGDVRDDRSRVKFQLDGLFSSYDFKSIKKMCKPPTDRKSNYSIKTKSKTKIMKENIPEEQDQSQQKHYTFVDYKCDFCEMQPIINIRYHCKVCEDYDLCQKCFEDCDSIHDHRSFEKIDGRLIREKAMERLFQARDTNVRATCDRDSLKSTFYPKRQLKKTKTLHFNSEHLATSG